MKSSYFRESSMEDSYVYKMFNTSNAAIEKMVKYIKTSTPIDKSFITEQYFQIAKGLISPLANNVIKAYDLGDIEILYSKSVKVGTSIPYIIRKSGDKIVASIFISSFGTISKDGTELQIPVKNLYVIMESAYIALQLQKAPTKILRNTGLLKICNNIYTNMIMRILNKDYSLSIDRSLYEKVSFVISRFFVERIWGVKNEDAVFGYASLLAPNVSDMEIESVNNGYTDRDITDINGLLAYIATLSPRMSDVSTRYFIEHFINMYHGAGILAIDYLPYLFFVIINVVQGCFLINQSALKDIVTSTKGINGFYSELSKLV